MALAEGAATPQEISPLADAPKVFIALAGNPNSGKTSLFNALTGLRYKVANYPGVTVEKKEGALTLPGGMTASLVDLPGAYSLDSHAVDEQIATRALLGEFATGPTAAAPPDLILAVVDSTNLERNLFLCTQLLDIGVPVIVALSMSDLAESQGIEIRTEILSRALGVPVIPVCAKAKSGLESLRAEIVAALSKRAAPIPFKWLAKEDPLQPQFAAVAEAVEKFLPSARAPKLRALALLSGARSSSAPQLKEVLDHAHTSLRASGVDPASAEAARRYQWIRTLVKQSTVFKNDRHRKRNDRIDAFLTHRVMGLVVFGLIMAAIFQSIFIGAAWPMDLIDSAVGSLGSFLSHFLPEGEMRSLLVDGIIAGVGSVLVFIPQIAILFFFIGLLEDSGYLARAAYVTDRLMRKFGLQGRSFVPLLSSFACAIPGIMSTRTIPTFADRLTTILVAPLMSCSARLPVYSLLIAAFIPSMTVLGVFSLQGLVMLGMYSLGILGALVVALILKHTLLKGEPAPFIMEMPQFRMPSLIAVLRNVFDRVLLFVKSAGTIILACSIVLWYLASHPLEATPRESYAGQIGTFLEPALKPLGLSWEIGVGIVASFAAREVFVSALATVYNLSNEGDEPTSLLSVLRAQHEQGLFSLPSALALLVFYVFACMCMSTLAVCYRETGSWRWTAFMFSYMTILGYGAAWVTYRVSLMFWV